MYMPRQGFGRNVPLIVAILIVVVGIIHLGVGIGIVAKYNKYKDVYRQPVALSGFNIFNGLFAIVVGVLGLIIILLGKTGLSKATAICSAVLSVCVISSLIAALAINSQAISYMRARLLYRMNTYIQTDTSIGLMDLIQTRYKCCGVNLWLDWATVSLGTTQSGTTVITGTTTTATIISGSGRRRRNLELLLSPLSRAVRRSRQSTGGAYNLPSTYSINLPFSCCRSGGTSSGNTIGGSCVYNGGNTTTTAFYVEGCLATLSNLAVSQVTGIAVINCWLASLSIVFVIILYNMFPATVDPNNPNDKQAAPYQMYQEPQTQNGGYYANNVNPNDYYTYPQQLPQQPQQQQQLPYVTYQ